MWSSFRDQPQWAMKGDELVLVIYIDSEDDMEWAEYIDRNGVTQACNLAKLKPIK